jgi:hypothetical protein
MAFARLRGDRGPSPSWLLRALVPFAVNLFLFICRFNPYPMTSARRRDPA